MSIKYLTIVTCDRCKGETRYDTHDERDWRVDWAWLSPATITPYGERPPHRGRESLICDRCLTDDEREQLTETRMRVQSDETFPPHF
jgi:hypothetical protein